jgi:hypothetical protein
MLDAEPVDGDQLRQSDAHPIRTRNVLTRRRVVSKGRAPPSPRKSTAPIPPAPRIGATLFRSCDEIAAADSLPC